MREISSQGTEPLQALNLITHVAEGEEIHIFG